MRSETVRDAPALILNRSELPVCKFETGWAGSASDLSPLALSKEGSRAVMRINAARGSQARLHDGGRAMRAGRLRSRRQTGRESPPGPDHRSERLDQDGRGVR